MSLLGKTKLLETINLTDDDIDSIIISREEENVLGDTTVSLKIGWWLLENVCKTKSNNLSRIQERIYPNIEEFESFSQEESHLKAAILAVITSMQPDEDDLANVGANFFERLIDEKVIAFIKSNNIDLLPQALCLAEKKDSSLSDIYAKLVVDLWDEADYAIRSLEICFRFISLNNDSSVRRKHGLRLGENGRATDLVSSEFSFYWATVYLGVFEGVPETHKEMYLKWVAKQVSLMTIGDWQNAIKMFQIDNLITLMNYATFDMKLPKLDTVLERTVCSKDVNQKLLNITEKIIKVYASNTSALGRVISSNNDFVLTRFTMYVPLLKHCKWFNYLSPQERFQSVKSLIETRKAYNCNAIAELLEDVDNPNMAFRGYLRELRSTISHNANLRSMPKSGKEACHRILSLLAKQKRKD